MSHATLHGWSSDRTLSVLTLERVDVVAAQLHYMREQLNRMAGDKRRWPKWDPLKVPRPFEEKARAVEPKRLSIAEFRARVEEEGV